MDLNDPGFWQTLRDRLGYLNYKNPSFLIQMHHFSFKIHHLSYTIHDFYQVRRAVRV